MRKTFLVKPILQLKYLIWTLTAVFMGLMAGYFLLEYKVSFIVAQGKLNPTDWMAVRGAFQWVFGVTSLILLLTIGIEHYLFFHRIVGPLYALEKGLKRLAQGDFLDAIKIRESDQLSDLIAAFEEMKRKLQARMEAQEKTAQFLAQELDYLLDHPTPENINALRHKLKEMREQVEKKAA